MSMKENIIGIRLKKLRESVNLSQFKLAAINGKLLQTAITRYESGTVVPSCETLLWYADYFNVSLDYIFGRTDNPQGEIFSGKPPINENNEELKLFVEMCFDPNSPINGRLKDAMIKILEEQKK